jgi:hypothetical protein
MMKKYKLKKSFFIFNFGKEFKAVFERNTTTAALSFAF